jgi:uncharacterized protein (DUF362 family)
VVSADRDARRKVSRRHAIRLAGLAVLAAGSAGLARAAEPTGLANLLRWSARNRAQEWLGAPAAVGLGYCSDYNAVLDCLRETWRKAGMPDVDGKRVLVKPNLIDAIDGRPTTTAPQLVGAVVDLLREHGAAEIAVGDGPGFRREAEPVARACGLSDELARRKIPFVDLNYDEPKPIKTRDGWFRNMNTLWLPRHAREADLIVSVPKLKTHHWAGVSLGLKNLFGLVPGCRYGWPKNALHVNGIPQSILGIYQTVGKTVAVVDGVVGMEGDGPLFGSPVEHGLVAVGRDPVAVDVLCARLMGFQIAEVPHLALAGATGVGQAENIEVRGAPESDFQRAYARPPGE